MEIRWQAGPDAVTFEVVDQDGPVPPERWSLLEHGLPAEKRAALHQLTLLLESERATLDAQGRVLIRHPQVAGLTDAEARALGLPEPAPFTLQIDSEGRVGDRDFRIGYRWLDGRGRIVYPRPRQGALLPVGTRQYRLPDPLFSLVELIDRFQAAPPSNPQEQFLLVGRIQELLPGEARMDDYLGTLHVVRATAFTLDPRVDERGEFTFDPIPMRRLLASTRLPEVEPSPAGEQPEPGVIPSLPPHYQQAFAGQFRRRARVLPQYALGDGYHLILDEPVRRALEVVRRKQQAPPSERLAFFSNPLASLREELGEQMEALVPPGEDPDAFLDGLFVETPGYGERVRGIGLWAPKVIPWIARPPSPWLPPEQVGVMVGDRAVVVDRRALPGLRRELEEAVAAGREGVAYEGQTIPATVEAVEAVRTLEEAAQRPVRESEERQARGRIVLLIADNLDAVTYSPTPRRHPVPDADIGQLLRTELKPHQQEGVDWLRRHWSRGSHGALLADDMGLGKTLQALAFLVWVRQARTEQNEHRPLLIVAPTGLLKNWEAEHDRHLRPPGLGHLLRAHGPDLRELRRTPRLGRGAELEGGGPVLDWTRLQQADWVLTTYETLRDYQHSFGLVRWAVVVFDEAQKIKTPGTLLTEAAKALKADFFLALTGTPVENRLADLWCIVDTVQPASLGDLKTFSRTYEGTEDPTVLRELKRRIDESEPDPPPRPKVMLRRLKSSHLPGLPPKHEHVLRATMPALQAERYAEAVHRARSSEVDRPMMLQTLHILRSISLHPLPPSASMSDEAYIAASARLAQAIRVLDEVAAAGERALIYVDSLEFQAVLRGLLQRRYGLKEPPLLINGTVSSEQRKRRVDAFQQATGFDVMILSPRAGGVGLTLTAATHVIHLSRWWNPAVEDQCTDRVYRIGQTRPVHVYFPMAVHPVFGDHSFDVQLARLIERKRQLSQALLLPGEPTQGDVEQLFDQTVRVPIRPAA